MTGRGVAPAPLPEPPGPPAWRADQASWSRWQLAALAVGADLAWRAAVLLPWVLGLLLGAWWWQQAWLWWLLAGVLLLLGWALWPATDDLAAEVITPAQEPALFGELERLRQALAVPPLHAVRLDDQFNAAAVQAGPIWWPWRARRTLVLGLPLLAVLTPQQASAVLAHELAHFSRRHGRLGHWLYRARLAWLALAVPPDQDGSAYDRLVHQCAAWFAPWFGQQALAHARACEFEADATATTVAPAGDLVAALAGLALAERRLAAWSVDGERQWRRRQPDPPADWWSRALAEGLHGMASPDEAARVWEGSTLPGDSHPGLAERAQALGVAPAAVGWQPAPVASSAGTAWLADWPAALARAGRRWQQRHGHAWRAEHLWLRCCAHRLQAPHLADDLPAGTLARALALRQLGRHDESLALLEQLQAEGDTAADLALALAEAWLQRRPARAAQALALLDAAVAAQPAVARPARALALRWAEAQPVEPAQHARLVALHDLAARRRQQAAQQAQAILEAARLGPPGLPGDAVATLWTLCAETASVQAAWLGHAPVESADGRAYAAHVLVLQVRPDVMAAAGLDEDRLAEPFAWLLGQARPSVGDLVLVRVSFTTELALPRLLAASAASRWTGDQVAGGKS